MDELLSMTGGLPFQRQYVISARHKTPTRHLPTFDTPVVEPRQPGEPPNVLLIGDSGIAKFHISDADKTFIFRINDTLGQQWEAGLDQGLAGPLEANVYQENDYEAVDCSTMLFPDQRRAVYYTMAGSGIAGRYGSYRAQAPRANDWFNLAYSMFKLHPKFRFDAIFVFLGTNDLSNIVRHKCATGTEYPDTINDFITAMEASMDAISEQFGGPVVLCGPGMGVVRPETMARKMGGYNIPCNRDASKTVVLTEMKKLLSYVNRAICDRAHLLYDNNGFIGGKSCLFGVTPPPPPQTQKP